jgi:hypothetical protein
MDLKEENILGSHIYNHWYYVSKGKALRHFLGNLHVPEVLDIGAGSGVFSRQLLDAGVCQSALCLARSKRAQQMELVTRVAVRQKASQVR